MEWKKFKKLGHSFLMIALSLQVSCIEPPNKKAPNVLLIIADDLGFSDLGCFGGEIETPHLNRLAKNGISLTRFYTTGRCCPSRASILTGQYPHRVGLGHMLKDLGQPGYQGSISKDAITIAQLLQHAGYRTFLSGKWHLGTPDPTKHGFEEFYGTLASAQTYWDPNHFIRLPKGRKARIYKDGKFYGTNALTDHALDFLDEGRKTSEKPWFLYLSYHAPHFPLHAPEDDIAKYADKYTIGWDKIREDRLIKMKRLGIIPESMSLSPLSKYWDWNEEEANTNPAWNDVASNRQKDLARRMAIYAAMIDIMDRNIGRLLLKLEKNNELENTMIIFLSDNGACAEWDPYGFDIKSGPDNKLHEEHQIEQMGGPGTYHSVGSGWANASNTPLRLYKHYNHEGGISSPLIVQWPNGIKRSGTIDHRKSHLIDLMPTLLDVAGIPYPEQFDGHKTIPIEGKSILPLLKGETMEDRTLYFEHEKNRAVISEGWKLSAVRGQSWELYDHIQDRNELFNLAEKHPDIVAKLDSLWQNWADKNFVTPHPKDFGVPYLGSVE